MIAPYVAEGGVLCAAVPEKGLCWGRDELPCRLSIDHHRERSTGPCFPLTVLRCATHGVAFTLYPPSHVPYGRSALAPVAPDGSLLQRLPPDNPPPVGAAGSDVAAGGHAAPSPAHAFSHTIFAAALDAARGVAWKHAEQLEASPDGRDRWWSTQQRQLALALRLVGVDPALPMEVRLQVAEVLSVPALVLSEAVSELVGCAGYVACGRAVVKVLDALPQGAHLAARLAESGFLVALWSAPLCWDPHRRRLLRKPFQPLRTRGPPVPRSARMAPTTLRLERGKASWLSS